MSAGFIKIFSADPKLGFLSHARAFGETLASGAIPAGVASADIARRIMFNDYMNAAVAGFFMLAVMVIIVDSLREWTAVLRGRKPAISTEVPFEPVHVGGN